MFNTDAANKVHGAEVYKKEHIMTGRNGKPIHQPDYIQAMLKAETYPHATDEIRMIQTHISWVFLTGTYAYKIKKPVNFGFLDFSTMAKRYYFIRRELQLNLRLSPDIYLDIITLNKDAHGYHLNGEGETLDYCLRMRQFAQHDLLYNRLISGQFDPRWMDQIAQTIVTFHASITHQADDMPCSAGILAHQIYDNLAVARANGDMVIDDGLLRTLVQFADNELARLKSALKKRARQGYIRPCHGDLHLKNIALWQHTPHIFDCIEFNDELSVIDTMNDIAFLVMDCDAHNRSDLSMRFLSRYLEFSGDYEGLELLQLYLFYRATVRGKVACLTANGMEQPQQRASLLAEARSYFTLASQYVMPAKPKLFMVGGLSGSGKSHLALLGCGIERAIIIRSDAIRKHIAQHYSNLDLYSDAMHKKTFSALFAAADTALKHGYSVILDATFLYAGSRRKVHDLAHRYQLPLQMIWLDIPESVLRQHIEQRMREGVDISDADLSVLDRQLLNYRRPYDPELQILSSSDRWIHP